MPDPDLTARLDRAFAELIRARIELGLLDGEPEGIERDALEAALDADPAAAHAWADAQAAAARLHGRGRWDEDVADLDAALRAMVARGLTVGTWVGLVGSRAQPSSSEVTQARQDWQDALQIIVSALDGDIHGLAAQAEAAHDRVVALTRQSARLTAFEAEARLAADAQAQQARATAREALQELREAIQDPTVWQLVLALEGALMDQVVRALDAGRGAE